VARDPRHLGAEIGFFSVLHTWSQLPSDTRFAHNLIFPRDRLSIPGLGRQLRRDLAEACASGKFVESRAGKAWDAQGKGLSQKFRLTRRGKGADLVGEKQN
jgi:hypothetical protein